VTVCISLVFLRRKKDVFATCYKSYKPTVHFHPTLASVIRKSGYVSSRNSVFLDVLPLLRLYTLLAEKCIRHCCTPVAGMPPSGALQPALSKAWRLQRSDRVRRAGTTSKAYTPRAQSGRFEMLSTCLWVRRVRGVHVNIEM
ncbi:hypothetical protein KUCAC02_032328, partial [Chaenocephalus aceratus]